VKPREPALTRAALIDVSGRSSAAWSTPHDAMSIR
jgi:hypothetical protein